MMLYHACWDMMFLFGIWMDWYAGMPGRLWQQTICWVFILLSGCRRLRSRYQQQPAGLISHIISKNKAEAVLCVQGGFAVFKVHRAKHTVFDDGF